MRDPDAISAAYRDPNYTEPIIVTRRERVPYSNSPLEIYAQEEKRLFPENSSRVDEALTIANNIANRVAMRMFDAIRTSIEEAQGEETAKTLTVKEALEYVAKYEECLRFYVKLIAHELILAGCFYSEESLLGEAVNPLINGGKNRFHLDCDLLCYFALHCAVRHDIPLHVIMCPSHAYLGSPYFPDLAVEMTAFKAVKREVEGSEAVEVEYVPEDLFTSHERERSMSVFENPQLAEKMGYFKPVDDEGIREYIMGALLAEMVQRATRIEEIERVCEIADKELEGIQNPVIVTNTFAAHKKALIEYVGFLELRKYDSTEDLRRIQQNGKRHALAMKRIQHYLGDFLLVNDDTYIDLLTRLLTGVDTYLIDEMREEVEGLKAFIDNR